MALWPATWRANLPWQGIQSTIERVETVTDNLPNAGALTSISSETDKIGDPTTLWGSTTKTVLSYANAAYQHIHMPGYIWPRTGAVIPVVTAAGAGDYGDFVEVVGTGGIAAAFDCHWVTITNITANGVYIVQFHIVSDADLQVSEHYLTEFSFARLDAFTRSSQIYVQMPPIGEGKRIGARALCSEAGPNTVSFNMHYHEYA